MKVNELSKYSVADAEKRKLIDDILFPPEQLKAFKSSRVLKNIEINEKYLEDYENKIENIVLEDLDLEAAPFEEELSKYCPKCGMRYPESENVCMDCLVHLKNVSDIVDVRDIESSPEFTFMAENDFTGFEELLRRENLLKINDFKFSFKDYSDILYNIKSQAFKNFDSLIKDNGLFFDRLDILDKVMLITKSFAQVDFKSYGGQLGCFEGNTILIDDRQTDALQITSLIHELSHFLMQEILAQILCKILNANKNDFIEMLSAYILSYSSFTMLIDEYSAHTVEGRFTIFGYQDYSSFRQIEMTLKDELSDDEIEITKTIGNTFAIAIKDILESFIDRDLRDEIKRRFKSDILDRPNYKELAMENCQKLTDEGFMKAVWLILNGGCEVAAGNIEKLNELKDSDNHER